MVTQIYTTFCVKRSPAGMKKSLVWQSEQVSSLQHSPVGGDNLSAFGCQGRAQVNSVERSEHYGGGLCITAPGDFNGLVKHIMSNWQKYQPPIFNISAKFPVKPFSPPGFNIAPGLFLAKSVEQLCVKHLAGKKRFAGFVSFVQVDFGVIFRGVKLEHAGSIPIDQQRSSRSSSRIAREPWELCPVPLLRCKAFSSFIQPDMLVADRARIPESLALGFPLTVMITSSPDWARATRALSVALLSLKVVIMWPM